jgi:hypothetical protein
MADASSRAEQHANRAQAPQRTLTAPREPRTATGYCSVYLQSQRVTAVQATTGVKRWYRLQLATSAVWYFLPRPQKRKRQPTQMQPTVRPRTDHTVIFKENDSYTLFMLQYTVPRAWPRDSDTAHAPGRGGGPGRSAAAGPCRVRPRPESRLGPACAGLGTGRPQTMEQTPESPDPTRAGRCGCGSTCTLSILSVGIPSLYGLRY